MTTIYIINQTMATEFFHKKLISSIYIKLFPIVLFFLTASIRVGCVWRLARPHYTIKSKLYRFRVFFSYFMAIVYILSLILGYTMSIDKYWLSEAPDYGLIYIAIAATWVWSGITLTVDNNRHLRPALWNHKLFWFLHFIFQIGSFAYDLTQATRIVSFSLLSSVMHPSLLTSS